MGLERLGGLVVLAIAIAAAVAQIASGATSHVYSVSLTITANQKAHSITGAVVTKAPSEFCDTSKIRIRKVVPGKDEVIARVKPTAAKWHLKSSSRLRGSKVYAEVSRYHLPQRPVVCLAARSPKVVAP